VLFWAVLSLLFVLDPTLREKIETAGHIASTINPLLSKDRPDKSARRSTKLRRTDIPTSGNYVHAIDQFVTANATWCVPKLRPRRSRGRSAHSGGAAAWPP
jgi:hypothetical protein